MSVINVEHELSVYESMAARFDVADVDGFLEPPIEIEHAQQGGDHQGAEGQAVAKGWLHGTSGGELLGNEREWAFTAELNGV